MMTIDTVATKVHGRVAAHGSRIVGTGSCLHSLQVQDLSHLVETLAGDPFGRKYKRLSSGLAEVIEDYGLVSYVPLAIEDKDSVQRLVALVDKATGFVFAGLPRESPYQPEFVYGASLADSGTDRMAEQHQGRMAEPAVQERLGASDT